LDQDQTVGVNDVLLLLGAFGCTGGCPFDLTVDGVVGIGDVLALLGSFGDDCP